MKKALTILLLSLSIMLILDSLNAGHALVMFLLAGVIPGTSVTISGSTMLEIFAVLFGFTLSRVTIALIRLAETHSTLPKPATRRTRVSGARA